MTDFLIEILLGDALPKADRLDARALTLLETAVSHTLNHQQAPPPSSLTVLLSDDSYIHSLNRDFMGQDKPTDVLSFPAGDPLPGKMIWRRIWVILLSPCLLLNGKRRRAAMRCWLNCNCWLFMALCICWGMIMPGRMRNE